MSTLIWNRYGGVGVWGRETVEHMTRRRGDTGIRGNAEKGKRRRGEEEKRGNTWNMKHETWNLSEASHPEAR